ncbi:MAG: LptF/LptG family permease [Undibacterium sp.]|nr:LptF/LptG family permease [Opitutaceae bacterium]
MNLLDRHIFKSVLLTCAGAVGLFTFVLMLGNLIRDLVPYLLSGQLPVATFARLVWMLVPAVAIYALPMGMLTGVLLTLGRLSADSEITAMRTAGLGLSRIARPVFILGSFGTALGLYVNFESMPHARVQYHKELDDAVRANPLSFIVPKTFIRNFKGYVIYVGDKQGAVMRDFWLWQLDREGRATQLVRAESGRFDYDAHANELILTLTRAQIEERNPKQPENFSESPRVGSFEKSEPQRISLAKLYGPPTVRQKLQWMTYEELRAEEARVAALPFDPAAARDHARAVMKVRLTVQEKFNTALAVLSFALIGVPLGIKVSRRETSANLGIAVLLALGYYMLTVAVSWLDRHPEYHPDLLFWLPNAVFLVLGIWLFLRIERPATR